jgi:F0F1-type ATP synthase membrane subunit b/b'
MDFQSFMFNFILLMGICTVLAAIVLWLVYVNSTEGAIRRIKDEHEKAKAKHAEVNSKLLAAEEDLRRRQNEAKDLSARMKSEAEEASKAEREKIIAKARQEGEEIIAKAQGAKDKLRQELEKENDTKLVHYSAEILNAIFNQKVKGAFDEALVNDFLDSLKNIDMNRISPDVQAVDAISLNPLSDAAKRQIAQILKEKLNRDVQVNAKTDSAIGGGVILKFGSMALDGSLNNLVRETGTKMIEKIERR